MHSKHKSRSSKGGLSNNLAFFIQQNKKAKQANKHTYTRKYILKSEKKQQQQ